MCFVSFRCIEKWTVIDTYFLRLFSIIVHYKILGIVSCAIQQILLVYLSYIYCGYVNVKRLIYRSRLQHISKRTGHISRAQQWWQHRTAQGQGKVRRSLVDFQNSVVNTVTLYSGLLNLQSWTWTSRDLLAPDLFMLPYTRLCPLQTVTSWLASTNETKFILLLKNTSCSHFLSQLMAPLSICSFKSSILHL